MVKKLSLPNIICVIVLSGLGSLCGPALGQSLDEVRDDDGRALIERFDELLSQDRDSARAVLTQARARALDNNDTVLLLAYVDRILAHFRYAEDIPMIITQLEALQAEQRNGLSVAQSAYVKLALNALRIQAQTDLDTAETTLLALQQDRNAEPFLATVKRTLGDLYQTLGQYPRAMAFYTDALRLNEELSFQANVYNNLGNTAGFLEDWDQSVSHYLKAIELHRQLNQVTDVLLVQANLGATYRSADRDEDALAVYLSGLESLESMDSPDLQAQFQMNLGNLYVDMGQVGPGLQALNRSLAVCLDEAYSYCVMLNHLNIGHAHYVSKNFDQALAFYDMTAEDLATINDPYIERQLMDNYSDLYRDLGDYERALFYFDRYQELDRTLINAEAKASAEEIQTRYETELKDAELAVQAEQIDRQRAQIQVGIALAGGVGAVLAVVILFLSFRTRTLQNLYERNQDLLRQNEVNQRLAESRTSDPPVADPTPAPAEGAPAHLEDVFDRLTTALQREAIYRDANLSLGDLAAHVASNSTYVSNAISQFANTNFNNLVNYYRIMDARRQLNQNGAKVSIVELANECGFNSKASFYRAFSKYVGMTPSQYLKRLKADQADPH